MKTEARYLVDGIHIRDASGRVRVMRGCNLGADAKRPPFRPFAEDAADAHFARLAAWGLSFVRLVVPWEAIEHEGPGVYDEDYLAYLRSILKRAEAHGIDVFIDPHQDAWSRWTGGDGAPAWTLEAAGFDLAKIAETGAAFTEESAGAGYRPMSWGLNYLRYACATMFTLFFAGDAFAPGRMVDGVPIQEYLQGHYIDAMRHAARRLKDCDALVGFGTMNEPHMGFIGLPDLGAHQRILSSIGTVPTAFQAIASASGFPVRAPRYALGGLLRLPGSETLNPGAVSLFRDGHRCPWLEAGAWAIEGGVPVVKRPDFFARPRAPGWDRPIDFYADCLKPFQRRFMDEVSRKHEHYLFFVEGVPFAGRASWAPEDRVRSDGKPLAVVEAFHWYEGMSLLLRRWRSWLAVEAETGRPLVGRRAARLGARSELSRLAGRPRAEGIPALLGEFGIPFNLRNRKRLAAAESALGSWHDAIDAEFLHSTIWAYAASNTRARGDGWNGEDLSIYCEEEGGARALRGFSRPYAMAIAGLPRSMRFDRARRAFTLSWDADPALGETEVFVPGHWYPEGWVATLEGGDAILAEKPEAQRVTVAATAAGPVLLRITPRRG
jgi:hypothetical protein